MLDSTAVGETRHYISGMNAGEYIDYICTKHPHLCAVLDMRRLDALDRHVAEMDRISWEFEDEFIGGRGSAYNNAQKAADNRKIGMMNLLRCFSPAFDVIPAEEFKLLDVLGGDGTIARFCRSLDGPSPTIYTADVSKMMVSACYSQGLPCIRQTATESMFRDDALDGVLIAYGTHHIGHDDRPSAVREAHRTLRPGGRLVLHDFEVGEATAQWFDRVVHPFSRTGHPHPHFTRREMFDLFSEAGFRDVRVFDMNDSFTLHGSTPREAKQNALMHMYVMYDLIKLPVPAAHAPGALLGHIEETLGPISVVKQNAGFVAQIARKALVAVGTKATN